MSFNHVQSGKVDEDEIDVVDEQNEWEADEDRDDDEEDDGEDDELYIPEDYDVEEDPMEIYIPAVHAPTGNHPSLSARTGLSFPVESIFLRLFHRAFGDGLDVEDGPEAAIIVASTMSAVAAEILKLAGNACFARTTGKEVAQLITAADINLAVSSNDELSAVFPEAMLACAGEGGEADRGDAGSIAPEDAEAEGSSGDDDASDASNTSDHCSSKADDIQPYVPPDDSTQDPMEVYIPTIHHGPDTFFFNMGLTERAGLGFPCGTIFRRLHTAITKKRGLDIEQGAAPALYVAAVMEYLATELLEISGNFANDRHAASSSDDAGAETEAVITSDDIVQCLLHDEELGAMVIMMANSAQAGVVDECEDEMEDVADDDELFHSATAVEAVRVLSKKRHSFYMHQDCSVVAKVEQLPAQRQKTDK